MSISFKIVVNFNKTSADIKTKSADVILKMTTILKLGLKLDLIILEISGFWPMTLQMYSF